jgi:TolB-like protein
MDSPLPAYKGDKPYVFISYAHEDEGDVFNEIRALQNEGINAWYDEGIGPGSEWSDTLAEAIEGCACFVYFITPRSVDSENCRRELNFAQDENRQILAVHLEETDVPSGLRLRLDNRQAILKYKRTQEDYQQVLVQTLDFGNKVRAPQQQTAPRQWNIFRTVVGVAASLILVAALFLYQSDPEDLPETVAGDTNGPATIAVLPLKNLSGDSGQEYFSDAVSGEIWSKLTLVEGLRVISMTSSGAYRDSTLDIREIGRKLTANFIIEGSAMRVEDRVRVNVHLIETENGTELWGTSITRSQVDAAALFSLFDDISGEIGGALPGFILGKEKLGISVGPPTQNIAAYNLLRQASFEMFRTGDPRKSLNLAKQAVVIDPEYAEAHNALGFYHTLIAEFGYGTAMKHLLAAREANTLALNLEPNLASGHLLRGQVHSRLDLDFVKAMEAYRTAEVLGVDPDALAGTMQDVLLNGGLYEQGLDRLIEAESRNPGDGVFAMHIGRFLYRLGRIDEALQKFEQGLRLSPSHWLVVGSALQHYYWQGNVERGEEIINEYVLPNPALEQSWATRWARTAIALQRGDPEPQKKLTANWIANHGKVGLQYAPTQAICEALFQLGDYGQYIHWFEKRVEERHNVGWILDEMRRYPDYWDRMQSWVLDDPNKTRERLTLVNKHRALVEDVTKNMNL